MGRQGIALGRNIEYHPVPPTAAGRGVWVIDGQRIALGALGCPMPAQGRRDILPFAAKAVENLLRVIDQDKELVSETLEMLQTCYQQLDKQDEWVTFLRRCVEENTGATAELMLSDVVEQHEGSDTAQVYITRQLQRHPTMRVFHKLMDYHLNDAEEGRAKESLMVLRDMVGEQVRSKPRYRCQKCGFTAYTLYWHCPSCRAWSTIKPIRGLDGQ